MIDIHRGLGLRNQSAGTDFAEMMLALADVSWYNLH